MFKSGKLWLLYLLIVIILNSSLFILLGGLDQGESLGYVLAGSIDYPTYLAKMKLGFDGQWEYINRYTTEAHSPSYIFLFYILLGHLARLLDWGLPLVYHLVRIVLSILALYTLHGFLKKYAGVGNKLTLFFLSIFISGAYYLGKDGAPQYHLYSGMMGFAHYMLTLICLLAFFDSIISYTQEGKGGFIVKALVSLNILALVHPFMVVLAGLVITLTVLLQGRLNRAFRALAVAAVGVAPAMFYFFYVFTTNAVLLGWRDQAVMEVSPVYSLFLFGLGSLLAYLALGFFLRGKISVGGDAVIFPVWFVTALVLSLTNLITSKLQWLFFASIPVAYLTLRFLDYLDDYFQFKIRVGKRSFISWVLIIFLVIPSFNVWMLLNLQGIKMVLEKENYPDTFVSKGDRAAYRWLEGHGKREDIVLANQRLGNMIPYFNKGLVYLGHHHETLHYSKKLVFVKDFFAGRYTEGEAENFLREKGIKYVVVSWEDKVSYSFLTEAARGDRISIYEYKGDGR